MRFNEHQNVMAAKDFGNISSGRNGTVVRIDADDNSLPYLVDWHDGCAPCWMKESELYPAERTGREKI